MITTETLLNLKKDEIPHYAEILMADDIKQLVEWLNEINDDKRYHSFLLLQSRSKIMNDVYPYWDVFHKKLQNDNSYQRSIGIMLIAENSRWDIEERLENTITDYLRVLQDEKPITIRQCIQSLLLIIDTKPQYNTLIAEHLMSIDLLKIKETMRKLILTDILLVLLEINKKQSVPEIDSYISNTLIGEILDKKTKKLIESRM